MKIEHIAIWVKDLELMRSFYETWFGAKSGEKYHNPVTNFTSYFLSFDGKVRLELMHKSGFYQAKEPDKYYGIAHVAFAAGSKSRVDNLTEQLRDEGFEIAGEPRITGDGYYESVIRDPEGNLIELTI